MSFAMHCPFGMSHAGPTCPGGPQEVKYEHHNDGGVAKLAVRAAAEQVANGILACGGRRGWKHSSNCGHMLAVAEQVANGILKLKQAGAYANSDAFGPETRSASMWRATAAYCPDS